jgi:hypothetical protein
VQTLWVPFEEEAARTAEGALAVCTTFLFALHLVLGVGDVVDTLGQWVCLVPAAVSLDYLAAFHSERASAPWQPGAALVAKKLTEAALDTPILVVTIAAVVVGVSGGAALAVIGNVPVTLIAAGALGGMLVTLTGLKRLRNALGDVAFDAVDGALLSRASQEQVQNAQRTSYVQPGIKDFSATFGLITTVASSAPSFQWAYAVPVAGPVWRSHAYAKNIQERDRRFAREVLLVEKEDLRAVDAKSNALAAVEGVSPAAAQVALTTVLAMVGTGLVMSLSSPRPEQGHPAENLGNIGLDAAGVGALSLVAATTAQRLQAVLVPAAWSNAESLVARPERESPPSSPSRRQRETRANRPTSS